MNVGELAGLLDARYPPGSAEEWDNVGLLAGDPAGRLTRALVCVDVTPAIVDEARRRGAEAIIAHHPPIFRPVARITPASTPVVWQAVASGVALYAMHTNFDVADDGTNAVLADLLGLLDVSTLEPIAPQMACKVVAFVPPEGVDAVAEAAFEAGAGRIGRYDRCSFRLAGQGTFRGLDGSGPALGQAGRVERVEELRVEFLCPRPAAGGVVGAIARAHAYETPAIDVYPLQAQPGSAGHGRVGRLASPATVPDLVGRIKEALGVGHVRLAGGDRGEPVTKVAVAAGAGRSLLSASQRAGAELVLTGEVGHHDAIDHAEALAIVCVGHGHSERPAMRRLADRLDAEWNDVSVAFSDRDADPFETR